MLLIMFFILVLNAVAIALTYYCLSNLDKKEKLIFIAVGIAVSYMLTSIVYWISTRGVAIKAVSDLGKNIITFLFVPINSIIILPMLAKSYNKYTMGHLKFEHLRNRGIVLAIILFVILIIERSYFNEIQNGVIATIEKNKVTNSIETQSAENVTADIAIDNSINNETSSNITSNTQSNSDTNNVLENTQVQSSNIIAQNVQTNEVLNNGIETVTNTTNAVN